MTSSTSLYINFWMSQKWWFFWLTEMPLTLGAIIYWLVYPSNYLSHLDMNISNVSNLDYILLLMSSLVTFWAVFLLGGIFLYKMRPWMHEDVVNDYFKEPYRIFQFCMLTGDVFIDAVVVPYIVNKMNYDLATIIGMATLAGFYGIMRVIFLLQTKD